MAKGKKGNSEEEPEFEPVASVEDLPDEQQRN